MLSYHTISKILSILVSLNWSSSFNIIMILVIYKLDEIIKVAVDEQGLMLKIPQ